MVDARWVSPRNLPKLLTIPLLGVLLLAGCGGGDGSNRNPIPSNLLVVNSLADTAQPPAGTTTLRDALAQAGSGTTITFDPTLDGKTIELSTVGEAHSVLKGEVYSGMTFAGYADRDYGKSALYAQKDVVLDASSLPRGITIAWTGGDTNPARVLAVYGNLTLKNITITGGYSLAEVISSGSQPYTLARGGGLAVWGTAMLENCSVSGNRISGDVNGSRDRGTYGGGIYAERPDSHQLCGEREFGDRLWRGGRRHLLRGRRRQHHREGNNATLSGCTISGDRVTAQHAYGGGLFTLAGRTEQPGNLDHDELHRRPKSGGRQFRLARKRPVLLPRGRRLHGRRIADAHQLYRRRK